MAPTTPKRRPNMAAANAMLRKQKVTWLYRVLDWQWFQWLTLVMASMIGLGMAPYTKVEESFQMQAVHDFLFIGFRRLYRYAYNTLITGDPSGDPEAYVRTLNETRGLPSPFYEILARPRPIVYALWDHEEFPGAVPRTFIGPFLVALGQWPLCFFQNRRKLLSHVVSRLEITAVMMYAYTKYTRAIERRYGRYTRNMLLMLTISQFHFPFYATRLLPNSFATILQLFAYASWLERRWEQLIISTAFSVIIFRFDSALLLGLIILYELAYTRHLSMLRLIRVGIPAGLLAMAFTFAFDSFMWGRPSFPELESLYFNVWLNKSHLWGVQPFHWYFTNALPRTLLFSFPLIFFASRRITIKIAPVAFGFMFLYSFLPHKELRFILAAVPLFNALAANTLSVVFMRFEVVEKLPESWLWNLITYTFTGNYAVDAYDIRFAEREKRQVEEERRAEQRRNQQNQRPQEPARFDTLDSFKSGYDPSAADTLLVPTGRSLRQRLVPIQIYPDSQQITIGIASDRPSTTRQRRIRQTLASSRSPTVPVSTFDDLEPVLRTILGRVSFKLIVIFLLLSVHLCCNMAACAYLMFVSSHNYVGGDSMRWLGKGIESEINSKGLRPSQLAVHIDNLVAQTGASRFLEVPGVRYDKTPDFLNRDLSLASNKTRRSHHSLHVDFTRYKVTYMLLESVDDHFIRRYCPIAERVEEKDEITYEKLRCNFDEHNVNCRLMKVFYGLVGIHNEFDGDFLTVLRGPLVYAFRCQKPKGPP